MTKIGVISDTHLNYPNQSLPSELLSALQGVDLILHAGDWCSPHIVRPLADIAIVHGVYGNCDPDSMIRTHDARLLLEVEQARLGLTHGHLGPGPDTPTRAGNVFVDDDVQCVVFGHSHIAMCEQRNGVLLFNPGSPTQPRGARPSCGFLFVCGATIRGEVRWI